MGALGAGAHCCTVVVVGQPSPWDSEGRRTGLLIRSCGGIAAVHHSACKPACMPVCLPTCRPADRDRLSAGWPTSLPLHARQALRLSVPRGFESLKPRIEASWADSDNKESAGPASASSHGFTTTLPSSSSLLLGPNFVRDRVWLPVIAHYVMSSLLAEVRVRAPVAGYPHPPTTPLCSGKQFLMQRRRACFAVQARVLRLVLVLLFCERGELVWPTMAGAEAASTRPHRSAKTASCGGHEVCVAVLLRQGMWGKGGVRERAWLFCH
jgi:hypothetical protein